MAQIRKKPKALNSQDYWRLREENARKKAIQDDYVRSLEINSVFARMQDECTKQIESFYQKYATAEGISYADAVQRVSQLDIDAYERKAKYYVENRHNAGIAFSEQANAEMRLYNATMKINRLEMIKAQIGLELVNGFDELDTYFEDELTDAAAEEYTRLSGILGETVNGNAMTASVLPDASYKQASFSTQELADIVGRTEYDTFSTIIWRDYAELKLTLDTQLARALVNGTSGQTLADELAKAFRVERWKAQRLIITETARVRTEVHREQYERNGIKQYEYMALGANPCADCADLDGQKFDVKDMKIGFNAPPMHPYCHCATGEVSNDTNYDAWMAAMRAEKGIEE